MIEVANFLEIMRNYKAPTGVQEVEVAGRKWHVVTKHVINTETAVWTHVWHVYEQDETKPLMFRYHQEHHELAIITPPQLLEEVRSSGFEIVHVFFSWDQLSAFLKEEDHVPTRKTRIIVIARKSANKRE